jgi:hypothetical protein
MQDSLVMGTELDSIIDRSVATSTAPRVQPATTIVYHSLPSSVHQSSKQRLLTDWLEMYDYAGGARFRGYIAEDIEARSMFVFFDEGVLGNDLKPGYELVTTSTVNAC